MIIQRLEKPPPPLGKPNWQNNDGTIIISNSASHEQ